MNIQEMRAQMDQLLAAAKDRHERDMAVLDEQLQRLTERHNVFTEDLLLDNVGKVTTISQITGVSGHV